MGPSAGQRRHPVPVLSALSATARRRADTVRRLVAFTLHGPPPLPPSPPLVSVVIPTYNYSSVLRHAVRSALRQTYPHLEVLVVGDACTDDSEEVVAAIGDPRVKWTNLERNVGSQTGPNNAGIERAAGKYVALLGHDDLWHPWHLAAIAGELERTGRPWGHGLCAAMGPPGTRRKMLGGLAPGDRPLGKWFAPSATVHQTALGREVPWRLPAEADEAIDVDVQDRMQLVAGPPLRVLALTSFKFTASWRPNCYVERSDAEQAAWSRRLEAEPRFLQRELASLVFHRLSPLHNRNLPMIERPPGAGRGWQVAVSRKIRGLE